LNAAAECVHQTVDLRLAVYLRNTIECTLPQFGKFAGDIFAPENTKVQEFFIDFRCAFPGHIKIDYKFFEEGLFEPYLDARKFRNFPGRIRSIFL